ncbi:MAG: hypothetical protein WCP73_07840 [Eubacteriales bacterium]
MTEAFAIEIKLTGDKTIHQINDRIKALAEEFYAAIGNVYYIHGNDTYMIPMVVPVEHMKILKSAIKCTQNECGFFIVNNIVYKKNF